MYTLYYGFGEGPYPSPVRRLSDKEKDMCRIISVSGLDDSLRDIISQNSGDGIVADEETKERERHEVNVVSAPVVRVTPKPVKEKGWL